MTQYSVSSNAAALCTDIRRLTAGYKSGRADAASALRELFQLLLSATVMAPGQRLCYSYARRTNVWVLGGTEPLQLRNGRWLRFTMSVNLFPHDGAMRLKVLQSSYQYQCDVDGGEVFRYDYVRQSKDEHPAAHLHIYGCLDEDGLLPGRTALKSVHFPTGRVSLESVLRLLIQGFEVPSANGQEVWGPVLECSELAFREIAHQPAPPPIAPAERAG